MLLHAEKYIMRLAYRRSSAAGFGINAHCCLFLLRLFLLLRLEAFALLVTVRFSVARLNLQKVIAEK